jgi:hypothetical protein
MSGFRRALISASRKGSGIDMSNYMTIEALEDGLTAKLTRTACEYSIDGGGWVSLAANTYTPAINTGHIISFKANDPAANSNGIGTFTITKKCNLKGNCMSMLAYDDAANMTTVKQNGFRKLFYNCKNIINIEKGFLPAISFTGAYAYNLMFCNCSKLINVPDLPATVIKGYCYSSMFQDCSSLKQAPNLPATILAEECYNGMFMGCTNLLNPPELPATALSYRCYCNMFSNCSNLLNAPELPATTLVEDCYYGMFSGCTSLTIAPELPAGRLAESCYYYMFNGCTSLNTAPDILPATTLFYQCYRDMFSGCTSLITAPELPATTLAEGCYYSMFEMCSNLAYIKMLATDISASECLASWVKEVALTGTFVKNANATWDVVGSSGVPEGWDVVLE